MAIEVTAADTVESYHLEVPAPEGLTVTTTTVMLYVMLAAVLLGALLCVSRRLE